MLVCRFLFFGLFMKYWIFCLYVLLFLLGFVVIVVVWVGYCYGDLLWLLVLLVIVSVVLFVVECVWLYDFVFNYDYGDCVCDVLYVLVNEGLNLLLIVVVLLLVVIILW